MLVKMILMTTRVCIHGISKEEVWGARGIVHSETTKGNHGHDPKCVYPSTCCKPNFHDEHHTSRNLK